MEKETGQTDRNPASDELLRAAELDAENGAVYPAGLELTTSDGRTVSVEKLGFETHQEADASQR